MGEAHSSNSQLRQDVKASFAALLAAAVDAIILINEHGQITDFSRAAERLFGYHPDEVIGQNVRILMPEPYRKEHDGYLRHYLRTGEARIIGIGREVSAIKRDGTVFPIELSVGEIQQGDRKGFVGIIRDVTKRRRDESRLKEQEEELRLIFQNASTAIATSDVEGRLQTVNRACEDLFGYSELELSKMRLLDVLDSDDIPADDPLAALRDGRIAAYKAERRFLHRDGTRLHVEMQAGSILDGAGKPALLVLEFVDRTPVVSSLREAGELRERLAHMARLNTMGEMATGIAHELNQPLAAIATYAQAGRRLVSSGDVESEDLTGALQKIAEQAGRAGEVIRRLRAMLVSREAIRSEINCNDLVRELAPLAELDVRQHNFDLVLSLDPQLPKVQGDAVQIQQIILNFVRNGLEAMKESASGAQIRITSRRVPGDKVEVAVSDSGPGVSDESSSRLFEPFYTTKQQGLGMGLAICRSIVESHGGELGFENNRFGGATFTLRLPIAKS